MLKFGFVDVNETTRNMDFIELNIFKDRFRNVSDMHVMTALSETLAGYEDVVFLQFASGLNLGKLENKTANSLVMSSLLFYYKDDFIFLFFLGRRN